MVLDESFTIVENNYGHNATLGNNICIIPRSESASIYIPNDVAVPTDLTHLTWEDFGITCIGQYTTTKAGTLTSSKEMNNSLFSGDITMQAGSHIRYAGSADWIGLIIKVNDSGNLTLEGAAAWLSNTKATEFSAAMFGMESFANTKFNLKIAVTNYTTASATVGVWVNNQMLGDYFTLNTNEGLGNYMALFEGTMEPYSTIAKPTGLTDVKFGDWNENVYDEGFFDGNVETAEFNGEPHPEVDQLLNTSLKENIKFEGPADDQDGNYIICWGGLNEADKAWYGLRFAFVNDTMQVYKVDDSARFTLTADKVGIDGFSFLDREYMWQVDITQCGNNVLVWMYFDGILYGGAPIVISELADVMSNTLVIYPKPYEGETQVERKITFGVADRELSDLYHDLDESAYTISSGVITMQKKNIVNGEATWENITVTGGDTITVAGDYKITYNDGVSNYIQEVVLWRSGDTKINNQNAVGAADLVRLIKKTKSTVDSAYKCEEWAYDVNGDYTVDTETDSMKNVEVVTLRDIILGTYIEDTSEEMPIAGFAGPTNNKTIKEETFKKIHDAGVTLIIQNGDGYSDVPSRRYYVYEQLTLAQKYGLGILVHDQNLLDMRTEAVATIQENLPEAIKYYKDYQSFAGLFIADEVCTEEYPPDYIANKEAEGVTVSKYDEYLNLAQAVNSQDIFGYVNLMGYTYAHVGNPTSAYQYNNYLNSLATNFHMKFISSTHYPFMTLHVDVPDEGAAKSGSDYFKNYALNRYAANQNTLPFWSFVQAGDQFELATEDSLLLEGEFKWSANMGLAFGSKGIQYFTLVQPNSEAFKTSTMGLLDYTGAENEYYDWAIDLNTQVQAIDHILMNATHEGIMTTSGYATTQVKDNVEEVTLYADYFWNWGRDEQGDAGVDVYNDNGYNGATVTCTTDTEYGTLTGCFAITDGEYQGKHALFVVNYNPETANEVAVNVGSGVAATVIHEGNTTEITGSTNITLGAGEAALVVF